MKLAASEPKFGQIMIVSTVIVVCQFYFEGLCIHPKPALRREISRLYNPSFLF
jgi:hypothetical protein